MDILVIDDEPSLRRTLHTTLETLGHQVQEAASGERAGTADLQERGEGRHPQGVR